MKSARSERFWDRRAREDPYFFVDTRQPYRETDLERFWSEGERDLKRLFADLAVGLESDEIVAEVGCGVGRLTRVLAAQARTVYALDVSAVMLARAAEHHAALTNVHWIHGDGETLQPLGDASVDVCFSFVVFQHIPDPEITLGYVREMGRVLRPGGWAAFQVSTDPRVHVGARSLLARLRAAAGRGPRGQDDPAWLGSAVAVPALRAAAAEAGLELERLVNEGTQYCLVLARRSG